MQALHYAGMLHDVGKMGVPTLVLQKQGRLSGPEADSVRAHPARGLEMLGDIQFLQEALGGIYHHHERMDGKGYPLGLKGMEIPEFARVIMVADAFDSMTSNRSYRPAMSIEAAIDELVACSGVQFDPVMVKAMIDALRRHGWRVQGADEARLPIAPEYQNPVAEPPAIPSRARRDRRAVQLGRDRGMSHRARRRPHDRLLGWAGLGRVSGRTRGHADPWAVPRGRTGRRGLRRR